MSLVIISTIRSLFRPSISFYNESKFPCLPLFVGWLHRLRPLGLCIIIPQGEKPMDGLMLHCGAFAASLDQIAAVPTPPPSATHYPIPHAKLITQVRGQLLDSGIQIQEEAYGLSHEGARVFGVLSLKAEHLPTVKGSDLILGIRNSHDKTFVAGLALGNRVFVCDNLSFYGTRTLARKHTRYVERDLPGLIARILGKLGEWATHQAEMIEAYEATALRQPRMAQGLSVDDDVARRAAHLPPDLQPGRRNPARHVPAADGQQCADGRS
jgi:hypothetical protein